MKMLEFESAIPVYIKNDIYDEGVPINRRRATQGYAP
jgi:hypothetical protein